VNNFSTKSLEVVVQPKESCGDLTVDQLTKRLQELCCQRILGERDLWLEITRSRNMKSTSDIKGTHRLALSTVSLGAFTSPGRYVCHWQSERVTASPKTSDCDSLDYLIDEAEIQSQSLVAGFEYDNDIITVTWTPTEDRWRMEISFDSLAQRLVLTKRDEFVSHLYLFIANQPKIYRGKPRRPTSDFFDDEAETTWERDICFGSCDHRVIGSSNAVHLEIDSLEKDDIDDLLQRLIGRGFGIYTGNPEKVAASGNAAAIRWPRCDKFEATYAWYCLLTRGFKVTDQISDDVIEFIQEHGNDEQLVARLLYAICDEFDNGCMFSLSTKNLCRQWETILQHRVVDDDGEEQEEQLRHLVKVRRILLTPTAVRALPAEHICQGGRVSRVNDSNTVNR